MPPFDSGDVDVSALHHVGHRITVGSGVNTLELFRGDVLFALENDQTVDGGAITFHDNDVLVFRPDTPGNYSTGTVFMLLDDLTEFDARGISLVEQDTVVGDVTLSAGTFLYVDSNFGAEIRHFDPTGVGTGNTTGLKQVLLNSTGPFNITDVYSALDLIEADTTIGGETLSAGTILASFGSSGTVGSNNLSVVDEDVFALRVVTTTLGSGSSDANATLLMDSSVVNLSAVEEDITALSVHHAGEYEAPTQTNNTGSTLNQGGTDILSSAELSYTDAQQAATAVTYTVTTIPLHGQLELTANPGSAITSFTQDDIDNNRVVYVHDNSVTATDSFDFNVDDGLGTVLIGQTFNFSISVSVIAVDDQFTVSEDGSFDSDTTDWFDTDWLFRRTLSFDNAARAENLADFPVLIQFDSTKIDYTKTHDLGDDLRFFDQDGTALAHEIEVWNEAGTSYVWVKVPQIDANSSTDSIVMYYGNAGVIGNGQDPIGVWSDYRAVYHLHEDPGPAGTLGDAAGNFDATNVGTTDTAGLIGNAQDFDGAGEFVNLGQNRDWINNTSVSTLSVWMNADTTAGDGDLIGLTVNDAGNPGASRFTLVRNGDNVEIFARSMDDGSDVVSVITTGNPLTADQWHHVTGTIDFASDTNNIKIYVDGKLEGTFSHNFTLDNIPGTNSTNAALGADEDGSGAFFDGSLDEARIATQLRSAQWVSAQYASMTDNFVTVGYEQSVAGVLGNDLDVNSDVLTVTEVNSVPAAVGVPTVLPSGALLTLNADGSFVYDSNGAFESLDAGDTGNDSFTYTVDDGNGGTDTGTVSVSVTGADDASVISGTVTGAVTEGDVGDPPVTATGTITISDVDDDDNPFFPDVASTPGDNAFGGFVLTSGTWTYTLNQAAVQNLDALDVVTDTITFTASDLSTQVITITITGTGDASVISGTVTGAVTEGDVGDPPVTATGTITISDVDDDDNPFFPDVASTPGDNAFGDFVLTSGTWTYTLDQAAVQNLDAPPVTSPPR